jgi:hypothetical protein
VLPLVRLAVAGAGEIRKRHERIDVHWRTAYEITNDMHRRSDILRAVLHVSKSASEISDIACLMESLPPGLQSYIAWDIAINPHTTNDTYERTRNNTSLLERTSAENIQTTRQARMQVAALSPQPGVSGDEKG